MNFRNYKVALFGSIAILLAAAIIISCGKDNDTSSAPYVVTNFLTLFKIDNVKNNIDLMPTDTITSASGLQGKYIPVSGNAGAVEGLGKISLQLFTTEDLLLTSQDITKFFRPEYHVFNTQLAIPQAARGQVYKIVITSYDKNNAEVGKKTCYGLDVLTCDPVPACIASNQITVMLETPENTPEDDPLYLFGSLNNWSARDDPQFKFYKNPDLSNCYCLSVPYAPGYSDWQLTQIFVTRGTWETQAVTETGSDTYWDYTTTERGAIWKIKVLKWRDK